jgi:fructose-bisphosphate aldolase class I
MFAAIHAMRTRIITSPCFNGDKVIGAILFEKTMDGDADGVPVPEALWARGVVPFLKVDKGLEEEADGVKLMKPMPDLDTLCERAVKKGIFGTKMRSVIERASRSGIAAIVRQQFEVAAQISRHGLMPIIEPEVSIKSPERAQCDVILRDEILKELEAMTDGQVMLKLTLPAEANLFAPLVDHPRVLRVVALSGGFSREEACRQLAENRGMIASFSRALLSDLRHQMSDDEFDGALRTAIDDIHAASVA